MTYVKNPRKRVEKVAKEAGGRVRFSSHHIVIWAFDDGWEVTMAANAHAGTAAAVVTAIQNRYGRPQTAFNGRKASHAPTVDFARLGCTTHARDRLALMRSQAGIEFSDLVLALRTPQRVEFSDKHESWIWVGERVAVCASECDDRWVITTLLWSRTELWDAFPRPGRRA